MATTTTWNAEAREAHHHQPPSLEMLQRRELPSLLTRPMSAYTDFEESWSDDDESQFEEYSPRESFGSSQQSLTTMTSYNVVTPAMEQKGMFEVQIRRQNSIQGPNGPHLFHSSIGSAQEFAMQLSPLLPKDMEASMNAALTPRPAPPAAAAAAAAMQQLAPAMAGLNDDEVRRWSPQQVAAWMHAAGFEAAVIDRFEGNDIDGAVLLELQFEDLKELDIPSFGKRHQIWNELAALRADGSLSPAHTNFDDTAETATLRRGRKAKVAGGNPLAPGDSVSIVAIEQLIPKPHKCSKGERCPKWRKQQRLLQQIDQEHGWEVSPTGGGGQIFIAGNPGNVDTAPRVVDGVYRPTSEAGPSVVASSDLLGPGQLPEFSLEPATLDSLAKRDPQENVRQFLTFQHMHPATPDDTPPSPPIETPHFDLFPPLASPQQQQQHPPLPHLRALPRLTIPRSQTAVSQVSQPQAAPMRFGTPASEMDVPIANPSLGPLDRDASQSVPPNMQFRPQVQIRPSSRGAPHWKRSSMALPTLPESAVVDLAGAVPQSAHPDGQQPAAQCALYGDDTTQAGWMKKRKARLLRHEWNEHHFRLTGTQLAMHKTDAVSDLQPLEQLDVNDYTVACSSLATDSKLSMALKSLKLHGKKDTDAAAFAFSLIPAAERAKVLGLLKEGPKMQHFAVTSRDERIDWMRSLMLAKALKQRDQGCEVTINGQRM